MLLYIGSNKFITLKPKDSNLLTNNMTNWQRTSVLQTCHAGAQKAHAGTTGLCIRELPFSGKLLLQARGQIDHIRRAVSEIIGSELPIKPNTCSPVDDTHPGAALLWLGPEKWLIISNLDRLGEIQRQLKTALSTIPKLLSDVSDARTGIEVSGTLARVLMAKLCALDLDSGSFGPGLCAQTLLVRVPLLVHQVDETPTYHLYVDRSVARYAWDWLSDAAGEFINSETAK